MNKAQLITAAKQRTDYSAWEYYKVFDAILETMKETLEAGETVKLKSFGNFEVRDVKEKRVYDINTGQTTQMSPAKRKVAFVRATTFDVNSEFVMPTPTRIDVSKYNKRFR